MSTSQPVYLLGAGFSKALSSDMPTLLQLGEMLKPDLERAFGAADWRVRAGTANFEALLGLLAQDQPWLDDATNLRNRAASLELSRRIATVIRECQMRALARPMPSWLEPLIRRWNMENARLLTFNYDTLVEKAYVTVSPDPSLQDYAHGALYPVAVPTVEHRSGQGLAIPRPLSGMRLAKLHGSINWYCSGAQSFFGESIYDVGIRPDWDSSPTDKFQTKAHLVLDKVPLIVPPSSSKNDFFSNEAVRGNWRVARRWLEERRELTVIGYSAPPSDLVVRGLMSAVSLERLTLIDVDNAVSDRYGEFLPGTPIDTRFILPADPLAAYCSAFG